jgi:hypothetical protein
MKVKVPCIYNKRFENYFNYKDNKTQCMLHDEDLFKTFTGYSVCCEGDIYDKRVGESLSLHKALKKRSDYITKVMRIKIAALKQLSDDGFLIAASKHAKKWERIEKRND